MPRFLVHLEAMAPVEASLEVEADDEASAETKALGLARAHAGGVVWQPGDFERDIEVDEVESLDDDENPPEVEAEGGNDA